MNEMSKIKRNPAAVKIANEILKEYDYFLLGTL